MSLFAYTASEIAVAIGWNTRRVASALRHVPSTGLKVVSGNSTASWAVALLPECLLREIERLRQVHSFRTADELLQNPVRRWQPSVGISSVCEADVRKADRLREALSQVLRVSGQTSISERAKIALPNYRRVFGRKISDRQLRALITRTIDRDRGRCDFARLDIYLPETPRAKATAPITTTSYTELVADFSILSDRNNLTAGERAFCWRKLLATYQARISTGHDAQEQKRALCSFVFSELPALGATKKAVKRNFERKLITAAESGLEAVVDRRSEKSGTRKEARDWSEDLQKLASHAVHETGGRISQAFRELHEGTAATGVKFTPEFREHYTFDVRRAKSDVPNSIRHAVRPILAATESMHRGPKAARLAGPSCRRDWTDVFAGDSYSADDFTLNHPFIEYDDDGEFVFEGRRFNLTRGQTLIFCDERSLRIHGYYLTPRPNYGAGTICAGINKICMDEAIGLPFRRFLFERGAWQARAVHNTVDWARIDQVFSEEGVRFSGRQTGDGFPSIAHATTPKAKIIERIGGAVQNLMQGAAGYVGRNQRLDGPEKTAKAIAALRRVAQRGKTEVDPRKSFLTKDQFCNELAHVIQRFNAEPQNGKMLSGLSPEEGWKNLHRPDGPAHKVLPESLRYLLATEVRELTVTDEGIAIPRRGYETRNYSGHERLGELIGEKVRVRLNPETPEIITVCHLRSDPKELRPFSVGIDPSIPAIGATNDDHRRARARRGSFRKFGRDMYRVIAPKNNLTILDQNTGSDDTRRTGEAHIAAEREHTALNAARDRNGRKAAAIAQRHNLEINPSQLRHPENALKSAERLETLEALILAREKDEEA